MPDPFLSVALVPALPWLAAAWLALTRLLRRPPRHGAFDDAGEPPVVRISFLANLLALLILLCLDALAILRGPPGPVQAGEWFHAGPVVVETVFLLDGLSLSFATLFALLLLLTVRFSAGYMHRERGFVRFFLVLNLFAGGMSLITLSGNGVLMFAGWELAGVGSWLLIGYALDRDAAAANANHALVTNRIGGAGFLLGLFLAFDWTGSTQWQVLAANAPGADTLTVSLLALGLLVAAMAKSAQFPFCAWIARAIEGPTPSSAIFYGAVMVHAGVFLLLRMQPLLEQAPAVSGLIALVGLVTALYGWLSGLVISDVKGSLVFSVTAQTGLMFLWCGLGWFGLAAWHLGLHAAWRAWQFLHAPSMLATAGNPAAPAPRWITRRHWLFAAAMQRFWIEQLGDALLRRPTCRLASDAQDLDERVIKPLVGLPAQTSAISSLAQWETRRSGADDPRDAGVARAHGVAGRLMETVTRMLHWFEENLVLKGNGEDLLRGLLRLGGYLTRIDQLLARPRYLLLIVAITLMLVL